MDEVKENIKLILASMPEVPGVYQHLDKHGNVIYIGKAKNLKRRVSSYFQKDHDNFKTKQLVKNIADIKYIVVENEQDAFLLENNLIKQYQPHYNILLKDGKSYPSICVTREDFPRVYKTRTIDKTQGDYYGPFSFGNSVELVLELVHELYPIRTCRLPLTKTNIQGDKYKVCLKYHLQKCCGICESKIEAAEYANYIDEIRKIIKGDAHEISKSLLQQMNTYAANLEFEKAQQIKRKYDIIEKFRSKTVISNTNIQDADVFGFVEDGNNAYVSMLQLHRGSIVKAKIISYKNVTAEPAEILGRAIVELRQQLGSNNKQLLVPFIPDFIEENIVCTVPQLGDKHHILELAQKNVEQYKADIQKQVDKLNPSQRATRVLSHLQSLLKLSELPVVIESFDNSNLQGTNAVAACVVFKMAKPSKIDYKKYTIKTVLGQDDFASMKEVVYRRYKKILDESGDFPNLIIADGGVGQMNAIREVTQDILHLDIPIAGLVKNDKHRTSSLLFGFPPKEVQLSPTDELFHLLTHIQDEVHRFAITFHKDKRSKSQTKSELDEINGVGVATKQKLLNNYKSVIRIKEASLESLSLIVGKSKASVVYDHFH